MVNTRQKNKSAHPAAPVMTNVAKQKAGIKTKPRQKRITKDEKIRILQARVDVLENPGRRSFSQEPLFLRGESPADDMDDDPLEDLDAEELDPPTEIGDDDADDDFPFSAGQKRTASSGPPNSRALKRTKAYHNLEDTRPTLLNKPLGLKSDWHRTVSKPTTSSRSSSTSQSSSTTLASPLSSQSPLLETDHTSTLVAVSPPRSLHKSHGDPVLLLDEDAADERPKGLWSLPRAYKDDNGRQQQPGLKKLPDWLCTTFRERFIRCIVEQVCLGSTPWSNPPLSAFQDQLNRTYPTHRIRLHSNDAAVVPTLRELGVLRNQIGAEGLTASIAYIPTQFTKRMLQVNEARARYIKTILADSQRPFIWEYFRPGTIPLPGEDAYYDQKRRGAFQSEPVLRAFSIYFTSYGVQMEIPSADPGEELRPIGALALAATAVERAYHMHATGDYIAGCTEFSSSKWLPTTEMYSGKIMGLTSKNWTRIFQALRRLEESDARDERIQTAAPSTPKTHEALLPDDPPTPLSLD